jgi:hypothetical protein
MCYYICYILSDTCAPSRYRRVTKVSSMLLEQVVKCSLSPWQASCCNLTVFCVASEVLESMPEVYGKDGKDGKTSAPCPHTIGNNAITAKAKMIERDNILGRCVVLLYCEGVWAFWE